MTIQASGAISFSELQTEFGGVNPIAIDEYYKGGLYVPADLSFTATATSTSIAGSDLGNRGLYEFGPSFNTSRIFEVQRWRDGGSNTAVATMTLPAGTYTVNVGAYLQGGGQYYEYYIEVGGVRTVPLTRVNYAFTGTNNRDVTVTLTEQTTLKVYCYQSPLGNTWQAVRVLIGGDSNSTRTVSAPVNANVPTSGVVSLNNYYSSQKTL